MLCRKCGKEIENDSKFCIYCGTKVMTSSTEEDGSIPEKEIDTYENELQKKAEMERKGNMIAYGVVALLSLVIIRNNWGQREWTEILVICALFAFIVLAAYGAIAAGMKFYGSQNYLAKYRQLKKEVGKTEAIKIIEAQYHPEDGFALLKGGGKAAGGCFSSIVGFSVIVIAAILLISLC